MTLVERIRKLCQREGTSFAALERELGFGNGAIRKWDTAMPGGDRLAKVADYFHVTVDFLLGREPKQESELDNVYFSFARQAQDNQIDPADIRLALETIRAIRGDRDRRR